MSREIWERASSLFADALEHEAAERERWIREQCGNEPDLVREALSLLAAHEEAEGFLDPHHRQRLAEGLERAPAPPNEDLAPDTVGRYEIRREIGRGGMGIVYEAWDPDLGRRLALKVLSTEAPSARERFLAEARSISALDHPNVCAIHDVGETQDGRPFLAMAFYEGETLDRTIRAGGLPPADARRILHAAARGLAHAHRAGLVHRDVKPSNLILTPEGSVRVLDFGIATAVGQTRYTRPGGSPGPGTLPYMAPERLQGEPGDARCDVWSLGVVLYELLSGLLPFPSGHTTVLGDAILHGKVRPLPPDLDVPADLREVLQRALVPDPASRATSMEDLLPQISQEGENATTLLASRTRPPLLPRPLTSFVGRSEELQQIEDLVSTHRLLTLVGPGGAGKSRVAVEAGWRLAPLFPYGVDFVELAALDDASEVPSAIARALALEAGPGDDAETRLANAIGETSRLVVLDNLEHLLDAAPVLGRWLERCPRLVLVVTSRSLLRLSGEQVLEIAPLEVPESSAEGFEDSPAVQLFLARAQALQRDLLLDEDTKGSVVEICRRLDGLPLALELAAARLRLFTPRALLDRLDRRFDVLRGGTRDRPDHHRTLHQAVAWSYDLLPSELQTFYRLLGVFSGGFDLELVEDVVRRLGLEDLDVLEALADLIDQSLLNRVPGRDDEPRFLMLETIREDAVRRLREHGEAEAVHAAHAHALTHLVEIAGEELTGPEPQPWILRLERDYGNVRAAMLWAVGAGSPDLGKPDLALRIASSFWRYWLIRGTLLDGVALLRHILDDTNGPQSGAGSPQRRAEALQALATLEHNLGRNQEAGAHLAEALVLRRELGDERGTATLLASIGWVACELSELDRAESLSWEALAISRRLDDLRGAAVATNNLAWACAYRGDFSDALELFEEARALRLRVGDSRGVAFQTATRCWAEISTGSYGPAAKSLTEAQQALERIDDRLLIQYTDLLEASLHLETGSESLAASKLLTLLEAPGGVANLSIEAWIRTVLADTLGRVGNADEGRRQVDQAMRIWSDVGTSWGEAWCHLLSARLSSDRSEARASLGRCRAIAESIGARHFHRLALQHLELLRPAE